MMRLSALLLFIAFSFQVEAQYQNVVIATGGGVNEPSIFISPVDQSKIVAGSNLYYYFISDDGGITWSKHQITSTLGVYGDPCITADTAGNFYYMHLSSPQNGDWLDRIVCQSSTDNGQTWSDGSFAGLNPPKDQDKEWASTDPLTNTIYMTWSQFDEYGSTDPGDSSIILFSRSTDQGETWSEAKRINRKAGDCADMDSTVEGAVPAPGPGGEVYTSWSGPDGLLFNRSLDGGLTWMDTNIFVSDIPGGWDFAIPGIYRANGMPVTCCDVSNSLYRGNIYINWSDQRNGEEDTDIWFKKSTDGGLTWSPLKRINDDPPGKQQFFTWMTVDQVTGYIYIVFYDRRDLDGVQTNVFLATSVDGGETFTNEKISSTPFHPNEQIFFGDYTNISAVNGIVRPVWTRLDGTVLSIVTAIIDHELGTGEKPEAGPSVSMDQNFPNPGTDITYISFRLPVTQHVSLKVYDLYGKEIATIIDNEILSRGKHFESFNISSYGLSPGIYFFHMISERQTLVRKMTVK